MTLSVAEAVRWSTVLVSLAIAVSSAELIAAREVYEDGQILSWRVARHSSKFRLAGAWGSAMSLALGQPGFPILLGVRLVAAVTVALVALGGGVPPALLVALAASTVVVHLRSPFGLDGAYQMTVVVIWALALAVAADYLGANVGLEVGLWFITGQLVLSYWIAGIAKVISPVWRDGTALYGILATKTYGNGTVAAMLESRPVLTRGLAWSVMALELLLPVALVAPDPIRLWLLAAGAGFHAATALVMGLNDFFLSFLAAYPAFVYSSG